MERIGLLGGTFDPPHIGHLIMAEEACDALHLDQVWWVLTPYPPHKTDIRITSIEKRYAMLRDCLEDNPKFAICDVDMLRPPPHYAVDTVKILKAKYPETQMVYIMGEDSLRDLLTWHDPIEFVKSCDGIGVMHRPDVEVDLEILFKKLPGLDSMLQFIPAPLIDVSSREIRYRVRIGKPFRYFLHPKVYEYIVKQELYQTKIDPSEHIDE